MGVAALKAAGFCEEFLCFARLDYSLFTIMDTYNGVCFGLPALWADTPTIDCVELSELLLVSILLRGYRISEEVVKGPGMVELGFENEG